MVVLDVAPHQIAREGFSVYISHDLIASGLRDEVVYEDAALCGGAHNFYIRLRTFVVSRLGLGCCLGIAFLLHQK